ncbi:MAG: aminopeptidase [Bacteroidetes bacterium]|nr:MAG: aminopeptidase [Bacteroidota bacterium]REK36976.1 MAG: aminopeptidase [Bacteroidota bacterium]REK47796.1 MAG: aminopeptidase [Bacteroidota bacterium]
MRWIKIVFYLLLTFLVIWFILNFQLVIYGFNQLRKQVDIIYSSRPITEVLEDSATPDSVIAKLKLVEKIILFAKDSLKLDDGGNYQKYYDQGGKPILWVLTACEPYSFTSYKWNFPILGKVSYKGFFKYDTGLKEKEELSKLGYDTEYSEVSAWSTLGWFNDPVLSGMLRRSEGMLAELLIHELTHSTVYLKSSVDFNENLASAIGEAGAERYLRFHYGDSSSQMISYLNRKHDYSIFSNHLLNGTKLLEKEYIKSKSDHDSVRFRKKSELISEIIAGLDTIEFKQAGQYRNIFKEKMPNNAYFMNFIRYDAQKEEMKHELNTRFGGDIRAYLDFVKDEFSSKPVKKTQ